MHICVYICVYMYIYNSTHACISTHGCSCISIYRTRLSRLSCGTFFPIGAPCQEARTWRAGAARFFEVQQRVSFQGLSSGGPPLTLSPKMWHMYGFGKNWGHAGVQEALSECCRKGWRLGEMQRLGGISVSQASLALSHTTEWSQSVAEILRWDPRLHAAGVRGVAKEL